MHFSRRKFIKLTAIAGGSALFGFNLTSAQGSEKAQSKSIYELDALIKISRNNVITLILNRIEMGQGVIVALPMIIADELDANWENIDVELAAVDKEKYSIQTTTASISIYLAWNYARKAAAQVKSTLIKTAAQRWQVTTKVCYTSDSYVYGPEGRRLSYGELAQQAAKVEAPTELNYKTPDQFKLIGQPLRRKDFDALITGTAQYGIDMELPDMLFAAIVKAPTSGAVARSWSLPENKKNVQVVTIPSGLAVVTDSYWHAQTLADSLQVEWQHQSQSRVTSSDEMKVFKEALNGDGFVVTESANFEAEYLNSNKIHCFDFELPMMAHATLEPPNALVHVLNNKCQIWLPTQAPDKVQQDISKLLNLKYAQVEVNTTLLGGGFGRKSYRDFAVDAVNIARQFKQPIKLIYSRETDIKADLFRPASAYQVEVGTTKDGQINAYKIKGSGPSILQYYGYPEETVQPVDFDYLTFAGIAQNPYDFTNFKAQAHTLMLSHRKPVGILRSIGHSSSCYVRETVIDQIASYKQQDPVAFRLEMLNNNSRASKVLELAALHSGWHNKRPNGRFLGCALFTESHEQEQFFAYNAQIAEVSVNSGKVTVHRVTTVGDFGRIINPDGAKNQMEGGVIFGMSLTLFDEITITNGTVEQNNFHDFRLPRMSDAPLIDSYLIDSHHTPCGLGEKVVPATIPAICNAISQATGKVISRLPVKANS